MLYTLLSDALLRHAGIQFHQGKTKAWNKASVVPDNVEELGPEIWQPAGITVLGTPIGVEQYISSKMEERIEKERQLWRAIRSVPDFQCAWMLLLQSANPRANHSMRILLPSQFSACCQAHDTGIWEIAKALLNGVPTDAEPEAKQLSTFPMRMGGLGLRSADRCARGAYWMSWADAFEMISQRTPEVAAQVVQKLESQEFQHGCLGELQAASTFLERQGFWWRPSGTVLFHGKRQPEREARDPGEWPHGLQYWASSILGSKFRGMSMLSGRTATCQSHTRSHSGRNAGAALSHPPTAPEYSIPPHLFRVLLLERVPLPLTGKKWQCVPWTIGPMGAPKSCMSPHRESQETRWASGTSDGTFLQRSRCLCEVQRFAEGPECVGLRVGRKANRSAGPRFAVLRRMSASHRHDFEQRSGEVRRGSTTRGFH